MLPAKRAIEQEIRLLGIGDIKTALENLNEGVGVEISLIVLFPPIHNPHGDAGLGGAWRSGVHGGWHRVGRI